MSVSNFIPNVWAAQLISHLDGNLVFGALCNRDYEGTIANCGDTVHVGRLSNITVRTYVPGENIADPEALTGEDTVMTIDHGTYCNFALSDVDKVQAKPELLEAAMENAAWRLAEDVDKYILGKIRSEAGVKKTGKIPAAEDGGMYGLLVSLKKEMDERNVPRHGRKLIVPASVESELLLDDRFITGSGQISNSRLEEGSVARAAGFDIYVSGELTNEIIAMIPEAVTFAQQISEMEAYRPEKDFSDAIKALSLCGAKVVIPSAVITYTITPDTDTDDGTK